MKRTPVKFAMTPVGYKEFGNVLKQFSAKDRVLGAQYAMRKRGKEGVSRVIRASPISANPARKNKWRTKRGLSITPEHGRDTTAFKTKRLPGDAGLAGYLGWKRSWAWYLQILTHGFMAGGRRVGANRAVANAINTHARHTLKRFPKDLMMEYHRRLKRRVRAANRVTRRKARRLKTGRVKRF